MGSTNDNEDRCTKPKPNDFENFVPWACKQLQIDTSLLIRKIQQHEYVSVAVSDRSKKSKSKAKLVHSPTELDPDQDQVDRSKSDLPTPLVCDRSVNIMTVYDQNDYLVQIKFEKNFQIPQILLKVITLIIPFYTQLTSFIINKGLDKYVMHELSKLIPLSKITELCLDDTFLGEGNYHILLDAPNSLKRLSLARCNLGNKGIEKIAQQLYYPAPASRTLSILNLASNAISDVGAKYLGEALRTNRQLSYLNLSDNMITDEGATYIFDTLMEFQLTKTELFDVRSRRMEYLVVRNDLIAKCIKELKAAEFEKKVSKRKSMRQSTAASQKRGKGLDKEVSLKNLSEGKDKDLRLSLLNMEPLFYEKAEVMVENAIGEYEDPFSTDYTVARDDAIYCSGNNTLCYLNIAYNNLSYISINKLLKVLLYQKASFKKPKGLINISVEGNYIPRACNELEQIDELLESNLTNAKPKKRGPSKSLTKI